MSGLDHPLRREQAFIGGQWLPAENGARHAVHDPATGEWLGDVPDCGPDETRAAIDAAAAAFPAWRDLPAKERARLLRRWHDLVMANQDALATLMTREQGKPLSEARGEVAYGAGFIEWFAEQGRRLQGDVMAAPAADKRIVVLQQPVGVTAAITPWNFPVAMITRKAAPALAAGCTMVIKPAEATPLCALALAALAEQAGIPAGVLSVVTTARPAVVGAVLTGDPRVRKLSFTGSTAVGKRLMADCAGTVKRLSLELGGNAPFIVLPDADLDAAVQGALASKYRNAGQTCVCSNRFLVHEDVHDAFVDRLVAAVATLPVGNGLDPATRIGPLITDAAVAKVERLVQDALQDGAQARLGGCRHPAGERFYAPTVLTGVRAGMPVMREESFGPVAPVLRFRTLDEAVALANDTPAGLAAYLYGNDLRTVWRLAERLEYGMVGINEGIISNEVGPFGGVKESGFGREGSVYGIEEYVEKKYLCLGGF